MDGRHWTDDELVARLYGVGPEDGHIDTCEDCARRLGAMQFVRDSVLASSPKVSEPFLAAQRRAVLERAEAGGESLWPFSLTPALSALALVLLAFLLSRPAPPPQPSLASSETQLFAEVYAEIQTAEPSAVAPIYGLFEVTQ
jgi:hypothetical protein